MPDRVKEKLVELLQHDNCPLFMVFGDKVDVLADYLIANGVTVQKWISVKDRLPEKNTSVLGYYEYGRDIFWYAEKGFNVIDEYGIACPVDTVTHWMPLPQPPKGE